MNLISKVLIFLIRLLLFPVKIIFKKDIFLYIYHNIRKNYSEIILKKRKIRIFSPNIILKWRADTFFTKEPFTLNWIDKFKGKEIIFFDIGANIGLYSLYAAIKHKNIRVYSFEPSFLNLYSLSKNVFINKLSNKISVISNPIFEKKHSLSIFSDTSEFEGAALNNFDSGEDQDGKKLNKVKNSYKILGFNLDYFIDNNILKLPNYIKIDVDGNEHLILKGFKKNIKNKKLKGIMVEINPKHRIQSNSVFSILKKNGFKLEKNFLLDLENKKNISKNYLFKR